MVENDGILQTFKKRYNINNYYIASLILLFGICYIYISYMETWTTTTRIINMYSNIKLR